MKLLIVSESIWHLGPVFDLHMISEGLANLGHSVDVMDAGEFRDSAGQVAFQYHRKNRFNFSAKLRVFSPSFEHKYFKSVRNFIPWSFSQYIRSRKRYAIMEYLYLKYDYDLIISYSGVRHSLPLAKLKNKYNAKIVFRNVDMLHKLWPTATERFIARLLEIFIYKKCQHFFALTPNYASYLVELGVKNQNIEILKFPIDTVAFQKSSKKSNIRGFFNIQSTDFLILFMGGLYDFGDLKNFIEKLPILIKKFNNIKFIIVGDGEIFSELQETIINKNLTGKVIMTGLQPFEKMPEFLNEADLCVNVFKLNEQTRDIFSAKIVQYLAVGKPVVSTALPGTMSTFPAEQTGISYCEDIDSILISIEELYKSENLRSRRQDIARKYVQKEHEINVILKRMQASISQIKK